MANHCHSLFCRVDSLIPYAFIPSSVSLMLSLDTSITSLKMVGSIYANRLKRMGITTIDNLLYHIPRRYKDYSLISKINQIQAGETVSIKAIIREIKNVYTKSGRQIQRALIEDETGQLEIVWYNQPFLPKILLAGQNITVAGEVKLFNNKFSLESPDYEIIKQTADQTHHLIHTGCLVPVYPETDGVSSKWLRSRIASVLNKFNPQIYEFLPPEIISKYSLIGEKEAIYQIHFPKSIEEIKQAKRRLAFDEFVILQLLAKTRKEQWGSIQTNYPFDLKKHQGKIKKFISSLPFKLTDSQLKVTNEIFEDLKGERPMNRLLEGDVGSGKTIVATVAIYLAYLNGYQTAFMSPTEILAQQHYQTISKLLKPLNIEVALLTGDSKTKKILKTEKRLDVIIGTHALINNDEIYKNLGLVIIDEQQRFGVDQRTKLRQKGTNPHLLTMTATPIPRTIALTLYADLNLSVIDEMPVGRKPIKTWVVAHQKRSSAYNWIREQVTGTKPHRQAFIVCPFIEESESLTWIKAVTSEYQNLKKEVFPDLKLDLLHGKLKAKDKTSVIAKFRENKTDILVTTPVIEVGLDIPNADIIMIEAGERFGLAQLHQLRGRVGRNSQQAYCLIFTENENEKVRERLKYLESVNNGPRLAELDLKLRGAGELYGLRQHGQLGLKYADMFDLKLMVETKEAANLLYKNTSQLATFHHLKERLQKYTIQTISND